MNESEVIQLRPARKVLNEVLASLDEKDLAFVLSIMKGGELIEGENKEEDRVVYH